jgi:hypothetical protein
VSPRARAGATAFVSLLPLRAAFVRDRERTREHVFKLRTIARATRARRARPSEDAKNHSSAKCESTARARGRASDDDDDDDETSERATRGRREAFRLTIV